VGRRAGVHGRPRHRAGFVVSRAGAAAVGAALAAIVVVLRKKYSRLTRIFHQGGPKSGDIIKKNRELEGLLSCVRKHGSSYPD
jgi:hypothetical protein